MNVGRATPMIKSARSWADMRKQFRWQLPKHFNIATACCDRWAEVDPDRTALIDYDPARGVREISYGMLRSMSNRLANALVARGFGAGDRLATVLPQSGAFVAGHMAVYKIGGIVTTLTALFGPDALDYRLRHAKAKVVMTDRDNLPKILEIRDSLPDLHWIYCVDGPADGAIALEPELATARDSFRPVQTTPDTPCLISYTSGTTGPPKGALHAHRVLLGHLPAVEVTNNFFPQPGDISWTPADWSWLGGLMNTLMPSLYYGVPVVAFRARKFDPDAAFDLIESLGVTTSFMPPTVLKIMRQAQSARRIGLRALGSGGEALGGDMLDWARDTLGVTVNEFYGQTECNLVLGTCAALEPPRHNSTGRAIPGSEVAILDTEGHPVPPGTEGEIAVRRGDPAMFLEYLGQPDKTAAKFKGDWMITGDMATMDDAGYVYFAARDDDVISSAGYRVGPTEIENCLTGHPDVVMAAVIGVPDSIKGEALRAFVVVREGVGTDGLANSLRDRIRQRLSPHLVPRDIAFRESLPQTTTGKIMRRALRDGP